MKFLFCKSKWQQPPAGFDDKNFSFLAGEQQPYRLCGPFLILQQCLPAHTAGRYGVIAFPVFAVVTDGKCINGDPRKLCSRIPQQDPLGTNTYRIGCIFLVGACNQLPVLQFRYSTNLKIGIRGICLRGYFPRFSQQCRIALLQLTTVIIYFVLKMKLMLFHWRNCIIQEQGIAAAPELRLFYNIEQPLPPWTTFPAKPDHPGFTNNAILGYKPPVAAILRALPVITHHPEIIHLKCV